jgi:hypothetical protein
MTTSCSAGMDGISEAFRLIQVFMCLEHRREDQAGVLYAMRCHLRPRTSNCCVSASVYCSSILRSATSGPHSGPPVGIIRRPFLTV